MTLEIVPAEGSAALRRFIGLPWRLYQPDRDRWIPPLRVMVRDLLDARRNPFYENAERALFLALEDGVPVGRIAAIQNRSHNTHHRDRVGFFGFYESVDDARVAHALFEAAAAWLRGHGLTAMRGPMNPSMNHECGLLVRGFRFDPFIMTPWNPRFYTTLFEGAGLTPEKDLLAYYIPADPKRFQLPEGGRQAAGRARTRLGRLTFRDLDARRLQREAEVCRLIYNEAWTGNWGFVPMNEAEFAYMARQLRPLLLPEFSFIAKVDGHPEGFLVLLPDFNQLFKLVPSGRPLPTGFFTMLRGKRRLRTGRVILLGIRDQYRGQGILPLFLHELLRRARAYGGVAAEASWVLEDNKALNAPLRALGARVTKRWRIYSREL